MLSTLSKFDKITAAGILARTALAVEDRDNPAGAPSLPDEHSLREAILAEARRRLGVTPDDQSRETLERLGEILDAETESLIGPTNSESALERLSDKGELPSDLFEVRVIENIRDFHGRKYTLEKQLINSTVRSPDKEQHFGRPALADEPFLISLFAKHIPNEFPLRSFTMLVAGQRRGLILDVHQAWRIYPDMVNLNGVTDLVDMLRRFSDKFGVEIKMGNKKGNFIYAADIPKNEEIRTGLELITIPKLGKKPEKQTVTVTCFYQKKPVGELYQAALATGINLTLYAEAISSRGW